MCVCVCVCVCLLRGWFWGQSTGSLHCKYSAQVFCWGWGRLLFALGLTASPVNALGSLLGGMAQAESLMACPQLPLVCAGCCGWPSGWEASRIWWTFPLLAAPERLDLAVLEGAERAQVSSCHFLSWKSHAFRMPHLTYGVRLLRL